MEVWKICEGYKFPYEVSSLGKIRSMNYNKSGIVKELSQTLCGEYLAVTMDNQRNYVHRVVAKAFLPNPSCLPEIDHLNRNKLDNRIENLRWANKSMNAINRIARSKKIGERCIEYTKEGTYRVDIRRKDVVFRKTYGTLQEAIEARNKYWL
jgi:hypothetical protein